MSFGFSPSDIVTLIALTRRAYKGWKDACGDFADLTGTLQSLVLLLKRVEMHVGQQAGGLSDGQLRAWHAVEQHDLKTLVDNCNATVKELHEVVKKYRSLSTNKRSNWDRFRFGTKNLDHLNSRLGQHVNLLSAFLATIELQALGEIHTDVLAIPQEIMRRLPAAIEALMGRQIGDDQSAKGSCMTVYSEDDASIWRAFRRDLVRSGIKSKKIDKYKAELLRHLRNLDQLSDGTASQHGSTIFSIGGSISDSSRVTRETMGRAPPITPPSDAFASSSQQATKGHASTTANLNRPTLTPKATPGAKPCASSPLGANTVTAVPSGQDQPVNSTAKQHVTIELTQDAWSPGGQSLASSIDCEREAESPHPYSIRHLDRIDSSAAKDRKAYQAYCESISDDDPGAQHDYQGGGIDGLLDTRILSDQPSDSGQYHAAKVESRVPVSSSTVPLTQDTNDDEALEDSLRSYAQSWASNANEGDNSSDSRLSSAQSQNDIDISSAAKAADRPVTYDFKLPYRRPPADFYYPEENLEQSSSRPVPPWYDPFRQARPWQEQTTPEYRWQDPFCPMRPEYNLHDSFEPELFGPHDFEPNPFRHDPVSNFHTTPSFEGAGAHAVQEEDCHSSSCSSNGAVEDDGHVDLVSTMGIETWYADSFGSEESDIASNAAVVDKRERSSSLYPKMDVSNRRSLERRSVKRTQAVNDGQGTIDYQGAYRAGPYHPKVRTDGVHTVMLARAGYVVDQENHWSTVHVPGPARGQMCSKAAAENSEYIVRHDEELIFCLGEGVDAMWMPDVPHCHGVLKHAGDSFLPMPLGACSIGNGQWFYRESEDDPWVQVERYRAPLGVTYSSGNSSHHFYLRHTSIGTHLVDSQLRCINNCEHPGHFKGPRSEPDNPAFAGDYKVDTIWRSDTSELHRGTDTKVQTYNIENARFEPPPFSVCPPARPK